MCIACVAIATLPLLTPGGDPVEPSRIHRFRAPIDAVSVGFRGEHETALVRGQSTDGAWGEWQVLAPDNEQDPGLLESNLVMFPDDVSAIELAGAGSDAFVHAVTVDESPVSYDVAGIDLGTPKILSREEWGADDDMLFTDRTPASPSSSSVEGHSPATGDNGDASGASEREQDCLDAQKNYPNDFKTTGKKTTTVNGSTLLWPYAYSREIDLLVVHHTAVKVAGDKRSGVERVRAIYQYHAVNRKWGDVGYHYLIDEDGQVYEGKSGGKYVVGGHAYCHNVNTLGIALLGNFEDEKPTQDQMKALQWLLADLAEEYDVNLDENATYHGQTYSSPIVGHGDVLGTSCPGYYIRQTLSQVRAHVEQGDLEASIKFPKKPGSSSARSSATSSKRPSSRPGRSAGSSSPKPIVREGISVMGSNKLGGRPGGEVPFSVRFTTGAEGALAGARIAKVKRSDQSIGVWQFIGGEYVPVRGDIVTENSVPRHATTSIQLKVQIPVGRGPYSLTIDDTVFAITPSGRVAAPGSSSSIRSTQSKPSSKSSSNVSRRPFSSATSISSKSSMKHSSSSSSTRDRGPLIRVRLESRDAGLDSCDDADLGSLERYYRGTLECIEVDGDAAIVNELPLEDYLMGLSEEPDTEPYEKQRAFAIAARTYAAHYMGTTYRKFPGKPYDGSDSPAIFQKYTGKSFEKGNPHWLSAVENTANIVLTKDNQIIRPPYFSSDDGRTRAPSEVGWKSFPFIEIFTSKDDPWCVGMDNRGHGVGMSGCGAEGQANEGKSGEEILRYYYPGTDLQAISKVLD